MCFSLVKSRSRKSRIPKPVKNVQSRTRSRSRTKKISSPDPDPEENFQSRSRSRSRILIASPENPDPDVNYSVPIPIPRSWKSRSLSATAFDHWHIKIQTTTRIRDLLGAPRSKLPKRTKIYANNTKYRTCRWLSRMWIVNWRILPQQHRQQTPESSHA